MRTKTERQATMKHRPRDVYNMIHQACKHIEYRSIKPLRQRDLYLLMNDAGCAVALVEVNNQVTITQ